MRRAVPIGLVLLCWSGSIAGAPAQVRPATITTVAPAGAERGTSVTLTIDGANLAGATAIRFGHPGLRGTVMNVIELPFAPVVRPKGFTGTMIEDRFALHRVVARVEIDESVPAGSYGFRLQTPLGTTNLGSLAVGAFVEIPEAEPNDRAEDAHRIFFPATLAGTIGRPGDEDWFEFDVEAGTMLVFRIEAAALGSALESELRLLDTEGKVLAQGSHDRGDPDAGLAWRFTSAGRFRLRIADAAGSGSGRHFYRLTLGELPYLTRVFPLGVRAGAAAEVAVDGFNLPAPAARIDATALRPGATAVVQPLFRGREALDPARIAIGRHPEILEREANDTPASAQPVTLPVTINGTIDGGTHRAGRAPDRDVFRLRARRGERIAMTVAAARLGSPLDAVLEVVDAAGRVLPRAVARPVWQSAITLNDPDSLRKGMRLESWSPLRIGDWVMVGNELVQVEDLPKNPDDDVKFRAHRGVRLGYLGTTPEAHALGTPVYQVELHEPGRTFPPNGMPLVPIGWSNDDGGPGFGKDSALLFEAPSDGDTFVRLRDIRGLEGKEYAYRLTLEAPEPDFTLSFEPRNPNVAPGGAVPVTVTATRFGGFDGPIEVELVGLPAGFTAPPGRILPGATTVALALAAAPGARIPEGFAPLRLRGRAQAAGLSLERWGGPEPGGPGEVAGVALGGAAELAIGAVQPAELVMEPGGEAEVTVTVERRGGFAGRVPVEVRNLPLGVTVPDVGLNGILITEEEQSRTFHLRVEPRTGAVEQQLYLVARIETNGGPVEHVSAPIRLRVVPRKSAVSQAR